MLSYHNDKKLKKSIVTEMKNHLKHDQFIKGSYGNINGKFKGCAVGCAIDSFNIKIGKSYATYNHKAFEEAIGVPEWLARVQDTIFEGLPDKENSEFAVNFLNAIPIGVNLEPVKWKFCAFILKENIERVLNLKGISEELREKVVGAIRQCLAVQEDAIKIGSLSESAASSAARSARSASSAASSAAWSAESAAWSAARSARSASSAASSAESAESAASSAAWSAAWSARSARSAAWSAAWSAESAAWSAESAASSAAYQRYAKELINILKELEAK